MQDAIATTELFAEEPGQPRRSVVLAVGTPRRDGAGDRWSCRVKLSAGRVDLRAEGGDSLEALAAGLAALGERLEALRAAGWRLRAASRGDAEPDLRRLGLAAGADPAPLLDGPDAFRRAVETRDLEAMTAAFAEDAVLHSPVTHRPFEGRPAIRGLLAILLEVFRDFRYTDELRAPDGTRALVFRARVRDRDLEGLDLLRFDDAGRIRDFTVMVRPRSALEALLGEVGSRLAEASAGGDGG